MDEQWKVELELNLAKEKQEAELRIAALERAVGVLSRELQRTSREARGQMGMTLSGGINTTGGVFATQITADARRLLGL